MFRCCISLDDIWGLVWVDDNFIHCLPTFVITKLTSKTIISSQNRCREQTIAQRNRKNPARDHAHTSPCLSPRRPGTRHGWRGDRVQHQGLYSTRAGKLAPATGGKNINNNNVNNQKKGTMKTLRFASPSLFCPIILTWVVISHY